MIISKELLDELLTGCERPEDLLGDAGLMKELKIRLMERMLGAELAASRTQPPPPSAGFWIWFGGPYRPSNASCRTSERVFLLRCRATGSIWMRC